MNKKFLIVGVAIASILAGCTRIETGEVGVRIGFDKQVQAGELLPGSFNQTMIGTVLLFPVKEVAANVTDLNPIAKDNSTMKDFDISVIYNINPSSVSEIYQTKSRSFHSVNEHGEMVLMHNYIMSATRNAVYKSARNFEALTMNDNRSQIEQQVREHLQETLNSEKLNGVINVSQVLVRNILPADTVVASANALVRAKNEQLQKEVEVKTAEAEARRIAVLNSNKGAIEYMNAMALMNISEGVKAGKVHTIVVPADFKGMVNVGSQNAQK